CWIHVLGKLLSSSQRSRSFSHSRVTQNLIHHCALPNTSLGAQHLACVVDHVGHCVYGFNGPTLNADSLSYFAGGASSQLLAAATHRFVAKLVVAWNGFLTPLLSHRFRGPHASVTSELKPF